MLFGVEGLQVIDAQAGPDGTVTVWVLTDHPATAACPDCGTVSARPHDRVVTRPRDVRRGLDHMEVCWLKWRWKCTGEHCRRKTFTESLPQVRPRHRVMGRLRELAGHEVAERGITPAGGGPRVRDVPGRLPTARSPRRRARCWPSRPRRWRTWASMSTAAAGPSGTPTPEPGNTCWPQTGGTPASLTCPASRGCWGRWRAAPPMTPRTGWPTPPRRGGTRSRLWRSTCAPSTPRRCGGCCPAPRITGSVPCERNVRDRLFAFYDWCAQNDDIPEIISLAKTISRWEDQIVCAVLTGVTNATSESLNRLAKLEARMAYGFRNPANQRRRVKMACTRGTRRRSLSATTRRRRSAISQQPNSG